MPERMPIGPRAWAARLLLLAAAGLVGVALSEPLWSTRMEAPQYKGEEALHVDVYAGRIEGDLREIRTLNQYIGVNLRTDLPELRAAPWLLGALLALTLLVALAPPSRLRRGAAWLAGLAVVGLLGAAVDAEYRLYQLGHNRGHTPFARVEDFTPPLLGTAKIANFHVHTGLDAGGWSLLAAIALTAGAAAAAPGAAAAETTASGPAAPKRAEAVDDRNALHRRGGLARG